MTVETRRLLQILNKMGEALQPVLKPPADAQEVQAGLMEDAF